MKLHHLQLTMPPGAEARGREFYGGVLGLAEIEKPEALKPNGGVWFQAGDIELHLGVETGQNPSKRHPAFEVEDLAAARAYLMANAVEINEETAIPGLNRFSWRDPFGNRIEFLEKVS